MNTGRYLIGLVYAAVLALSPSGCARQKQQHFGRLVFGIDNFTLASAPVFVAQEQGSWKSEGLDVEVRPFASGRLALDALLSGSVDAATAADEPVVLSAFLEPRVRIIATFSHSEKHVGMLARTDRGIHGPANLGGKKIGVSLGTAGELVMDRVLEANRISRSEVKVVSLRPPDLVAAIVRGDVDAIFTWQPFLYNAEQQLRGQTFALTSEGIYDHPFNIVVLAESSTSRQDLLRRLVTGLTRATEYMSSNRRQSIGVVARNLGMDTTALESLWDGYHFEVGLKPGYAQALAEEGSWAKRAGLVARDAQEPNYLTIIDRELLPQPPRNGP